MKKVFFWLLFTTVISFGEVSQVLPLKNDYQSLMSRIETLMSPDLREFTFSTYILKLDQGGMFFLALLKQAADRGVKIKGVVDSKIIGESPELLSFLKSNNIEIYYYNPIKFKNFSFFNPIASIRKLNSRLHDKIWAAKFYNNETGSFRYLSLFGDKNISLDYYKQSRVFEKSFNSMLGQELLIDNNSIGRQAFDYLQKLIEASDPYSSQKRFSTLLAERFDKKIQVYKRWLSTQFKASSNLEFWENWKNFPSEVNNDRIQFLSDSSAETTYFQLLKELRNVNHGEDIYIENPYFILEPELIETLKILKEKSCKVTLVSNLPQVNNVWIAGKALEVDLQKIADLGVDVYLIDKKQDITHAKLAIIGKKKYILVAQTLILDL